MIPKLGSAVYGSLTSSPSDPFLLQIHPARAAGGRGWPACPATTNCRLPTAGHGSGREHSRRTRGRQGYSGVYVTIHQTATILLSVSSFKKSLQAMGEGKRQERNMKFIFIYMIYTLFDIYIIYIYDIYSIWLQLEISYVFKAKSQAAHKPQSGGFVTSAGSTARVLKGHQWTNLVSSLFFFTQTLFQYLIFFFTIKMFLKLFFSLLFHTLLC